MQKPEPLKVRPAEWPRDLPAARRLLEDYFASLREDPAVPPSIRGRDRGPELKALPTRFQDAASALLLASSGEHILGCAAVQLLPHRERAVEIKRLYLSPEARGQGAGRALVQAAIGWARDHGAHELLLDTVPEAMSPAVRLYQALGFVPTERYNENEGCCFAFFRLDLR